MAAQSSAAANSSISLSQKVSNVISGCPDDYNSWRSLILELETASPEDMNTISLAYDSFLSRFPLCHWHLEKYAYQKAKFCNSQEAVDIYERAVEVAMYSVGFWADYFTFAAACFESPADIRRLFERAISFVGKDYFCHVLWDKYMKYEFNQEGWSFLAQSYIWALRFPTKKLRLYYDNFKQFVANLEEEIGYEKNDSIVEQLSVPCAAIELSKDEISLVIKDMLGSSNRPLKSKVLDRYRSIGEEFYVEACRMDKKVKHFETKIQRRFFDVTPLDDDQLNNWHLYLDFIEKQDNLDWTMKLYERCVIPCACYPEFWIRYVEFLESKGGRELAISALDRATQIFVKSAPEIHLFDAWFKEHIGDADGARAAVGLCDPKTDSSFIESVAAQANLERRLGNFAAASATYEKALKKAREKQKLHHLPTLYSHFARLTYLTTGSTAASRDVFIEGIQQVPHCRFLLEEFLKFAMTHEGASHLNIISSIIADAISPGLDENEGLDTKDREKISCLFLEFVNLCGTLHDMREAWKRHVKLFPQSLRLKTPSKHPASGNYPIGSARDKKGKYDQPVLSQPSTNHSDQPHGQEQVPESPNEVVRNPAPLMDQSSNAEEKLQLLSTKEVLSNGDESRDSEPANGVSCQSREDGLGPMVVAAEFSDHAKENTLTDRDSDQDFSSQFREEPGPMDVSAVQSKVDEVGKSTETTESIEASRSSLPNVQPELDHELNQPKRTASSDHNSLKSQEKESRDLIPMSCDEYGTSPKSIHSVDFLKVHSESERDGSVSRQHNAPMEVHHSIEPSSTRDDSIKIDRVVQAPKHATSRFQDQDQAQDRELKLVTNLGRGRRSQLEVGAVGDDKVTEQDEPVVNQGNAEMYPASQQRSQSEDRATDLDQQTDTMTPPASISMTGGQQPGSSQQFSYAQQNTNPTSPTTQQQWQEHRSLAMNQMMLQYHYQQQQLLQQQYQQQLQMQHPYYQMQHQYMNQQPYPPQQQYVEQQQHPQVQQGHEPHPSSQQAHDSQYQQSQDVAYQAHQLAYQQHTSQEQQQLLWQQQYQQYQLLQQQQQGYINTQGHNVHYHPSGQPGEQLQQYHQQAHPQHKFTQSMSQNQQGTPDYAAAAGASSSPPVGTRSPQASK